MKRQTGKRERITAAVKTIGTLILAVALTTQLQAAKKSKRKSLDHRLHAVLQKAGITALDPGPPQDPDRVLLGQMLFFDKELSGNRDISCATCHHPSLASGDSLSLSIGTGGSDLGVFRARGAGRSFIPRNSPEIFNRNSPEWTSMFWDSRIEDLGGGIVLSPAGAELPGSLNTLLSIQAMFPVTSRDEMRGSAADAFDILKDNELAAIPDDDMPMMWDALVARLWKIPQYRVLFQNAFPGVVTDTGTPDPPAGLGFEHAATAIAAFEAAAFTLLDSPWDKFLARDGDLSDAEKRGALLFYGKANCSNCHSGNLLTDQKHYNIGVPQLGPGKAPDAPLDLGRFRETRKAADRFAFRTPPLRNVAVTGPWMHNGAYTSLEGAVRHHLKAVRSLLKYDVFQLFQDELQETVRNDRETLVGVLTTMDHRDIRPVRLSSNQIADLIAFLNALTSPSLPALEDTIPESVPSGLPVDILTP